jgi:methylenetetrahydrofolate reductase (NADPH)
MSNTLPTISFEFFPPKNQKMANTIFKTANILSKLDPKFMTVTYGAGGSGRGWTMETALEITERTSIPTAAHLTCINVYKKALMGIADTFWDNGIRHIVALRGDIPEEDRPLDYSNYNYFHYSSQLVEALKDLHPAFEISVAAYPEKHPDAESLDADIQALKKKCEAGANRAITQFFYDNDVYYRFVEKAQKAGIETPIVPGILPIVSYERMIHFADICQTNVPKAIRDKFEKIGDDQKAAEEAAKEILVSQVEDLVKNEVPHLHFYTLNRPTLSKYACDAIGIGSKSESSSTKNLKLVK